MFKYEIEDELKHLSKIDIERFRKKLDKLTKKQNKIVLFKNKNQKYSGYYCTKCKKWHFLESKKINHLNSGDFITCESCKTRLKIIYRNNKINDLRDYFAICESNRRNELIVRLFFYKKSYDKKYGQFNEEIYEVERINIDHRIAMKNNSYCVMGCYYINHGPTRKGWMRDRTAYYKEYRYNNIFSTKNEIKKIIKNNELFKYTCLDLTLKDGIDIMGYLKNITRYPKIELLMKAGCTRIVKDICDVAYTGSSYILNRLNKKEINMLKKYNMTYKELLVFKKTQIEDYSIIKKGAIINYHNANLKHNDKKLIKYLYENKVNIRDYEDYKRWIEELGMDLKNNRVVYPNNFKKAHDSAMKEVVINKNKIINKGIAEYALILEKLEYRKGDFIIIPAHDQQELINESKELNHCVRTYAEKVSKKETAIFFIRKKDNQEVPFVTLELKNKKVVQCRAKNNSKPNDEVVGFVDAWCKKNKLESCFN